MGALYVAAEITVGRPCHSGLRHRRPRLEIQSDGGALCRNHASTALGRTTRRRLCTRALQAYTYGSAYAESYEHEIGTLERGKLADVVVMDRNLFTATPEEILNANVAFTIIDGEVVYEA